MMLTKTKNIFLLRKPCNNIKRRWSEKTMSINNYHQILTRGSSYTTLATVNWRKRRAALNNNWSQIETPEKKLRALKLLLELNERIDKLGNLVDNVRRYQRKLAIEAQNQFIILECSNRLCQDGPGGFVMSVRADRFEEGSFHCGNCGCVLRVEGSSEIDDMLEEMNIGLAR